MPQDSCRKKWTVLLTSQSIETVSSIMITDAEPKSPPIVRTVAARGEGIEELMAAIARHRTWMEQGGRLVARRRAQLRLRVETILKDRVLAAAREEAGLEREVERGFEERIDPYALAGRLFDGVVAAESGRGEEP